LSKTDLPTHWITELFKVFQARYLAKWTSSIAGIEERAVLEWAKGLNGLSGEQIKHGLDNWNCDWPPTMNEFKQCCNPRIEPCHKEFDKKLLLPRLKASDEVVEKQREKLRKLGILK